MAKGGKRPGAGRPPGSKTKKSVAIALAAAAAGESPLEYLLRVMRDPSVDDDVRRASAIAAAPFVHPRLAATTVKGDANEPLEVVIFKTTYEAHDAERAAKSDPSWAQVQQRNDAAAELAAAREKLAVMQRVVPLLDPPED
jgi:hypothetical protein